MKLTYREVFTGLINITTFVVLCLVVSFLVIKNKPIIIKNPVNQVNGSSPVTSPIKTSSPVSSRTQNDPLFTKNPSWSQDFSGTTPEALKSNYWNILEGPALNSNREQQYYTSSESNLKAENGILKIIATHQPQPMGFQYASARLETEGKQEFLYGRLDVMAKLPKGTGTWPAIWLLPANNIYADKSPESNPLRYKNGGEIDIMEAVGYKPNLIYGVAHTASDLQNRPDGTGKNGSIIVPDSADKFNKYSLLWTPDKLIYQINDQTFFTYSKPKNSDYTTWPYDQPFFLIINLAMGGVWGGMDRSKFPENGIDNSALPATFEIDSIDYYPLAN